MGLSRTLREPIGEGGYGTVYRAEQPSLEREVVVKLLREECGAPAARERFLREARLAAQLRHPYAAQVYAFGAADDGRLLWIAMEQVQGVSLGDWLEQHGPMPLERLVPFFVHVCEVVHAAFSPDGRQIVTTDDQAAQVWDAQTYRRTSVLFHGDTVYRALYSADGARIVTAGGDGTVTIWDAATGALARELRHDGARLRYFLAALSPDGRLVAAIDTKGNVAHVWDAATGAPIAEIHGGESRAM